MHLFKISRNASTSLVIFTTFFLCNCAHNAHNMTVKLTEGNDSAIRGDYATAIQRYEASLKDVPDSMTAKRNLGIVLVKVGQYKRARQLLSESAVNYPNDAEVQYFLGEACRGLEDFTRAAAAYQKALRQDSKDLRVIKALAWTWYKTGNYEKSLIALEPYLNSNNDDVQLKLIITNNYNKQRNFQRTIDILSPLEQNNFKVKSADSISAETERALIISALADAYLGKNNFNKADLLYNEVLKSRPFLSTALTGSAKCELKRKQQTKAVNKLELAIKADPEYPDAHYLLGKIFENSDDTKSTYYYKRFILLSKNKRDYSNEIQATRLSLTNMEKGKFKEK